MTLPSPARSTSPLPTSLTSTTSGEVLSLPAERCGTQWVESLSLHPLPSPACSDLVTLTDVDQPEQLALFKSRSGIDVWNRRRPSQLWRSLCVGKTLFRNSDGITGIVVEVSLVVLPARLVTVKNSVMENSGEF